MQPVPSSTPPVPRAEPIADAAGVSTAVEPGSHGSISALVRGGDVANPPALLASDGMRELLRAVAEEYDYVLIDAPPPLEVSDAMPLLALVDGIVLVTRVGHTRRVSALRLAQLLGRTASAPVLGAVANCVPRKDVERYGFVWAPPVRGGRRKLSSR
jgi:Mrp family chromosome partitioning ATPase